MKPSTFTRRALLGALITGTTVLGTGCSSNPGGFSLASMNPFSSGTPSSIDNEPGATAKMTESIASTASGARNQVATMGSTVKSAWGKSTETVLGIFGGPEGEDESASSPDPLRLDNKPKSISPEVFVANGQLWESTGDYNKAMESYVRALESEASNTPALTSIARLHFRQGQHKKAAEFFQKAIQQSPEDAGLYNDLGLTLSKMGNHEGAAQTLQRALQLAPGTSRYANNLASVKFEAGDPSSAYNVLASSNKPAVAHFNMAYLHFKKGQMNDARGHLGQALKYEPQAGDDTSVKRAIDRSRDMLAQIDGSLGPIAQAVPQTRIAGLPNANTGVQQTSQSQTAGASPHVAPASASQVPPSAPSWAASPQAPAAPAAPSTAPATPSKATTPSFTNPATTPSFTNPATPPSTFQVPAATGGSPSTSPSVPFSMPTGLGQ